MVDQRNINYFQAQTVLNSANYLVQLQPKTDQIRTQN